MRLLTESKRVTSLLIGLASPKYSIYSNLKLSSDLRKVCDMVRGWGEGWPPLLHDKVEKNFLETHSLRICSSLVTLSFFSTSSWALALDCKWRRFISELRKQTENYRQSKLIKYQRCTKYNKTKHLKLSVFKWFPFRVRFSVTGLVFWL